ncbi:nuclear transport factor 2-like protein [Microlunatus ginsengisoli]|uniref:SnoaL-like domain-containing protein n=1 Tax=Microlunatus ginsengisoli TaxID=363863 RepID=A0ABP6ZRM9_9ACTN
MIEDILVTGPPWRTRVAIRLHDFAVAGDGTDVYTNRAIAFLELRWGRLVVWEDYEDTERSAEWDSRRGPLPTCERSCGNAAGEAMDRAVGPVRASPAEGG